MKNSSSLSYKKLTSVLTENEKNKWKSDQILVVERSQFQARIKSYACDVRSNAVIDVASISNLGRNWRVNLSILGCTYIKEDIAINYKEYRPSISYQKR